MSDRNTGSLTRLFALMGAASMATGCTVAQEGGQGGGSGIFIVPPPVIIGSPGIVIGPHGREGGEGGEGGEGSGSSGLIVIR